MQNTSFLGLNKPEYNDFADIEILNQNMDTIDQTFALNHDIVLTASGWSVDAPYTQTISIEGLNGDSTPIPLLNTSGSTNFTEEKNMRKNFGFISYYETSTGSITFVAKHKKPTINLSVRLKGV